VVQTKQDSRRNLRRCGSQTEAGSALKVVEEGPQALIEDLASGLDRIGVAEAQPMTSPGSPTASISVRLPNM
jgi:hypothetical protein